VALTVTVVTAVTAEMPGSVVTAVLVPMGTQALPMVVTVAMAVIPALVVRPVAGAAA